MTIDKKEIVNLDQTIASFVLPRLIIIKKNHYSYPPSITNDEWNEKLQKMIDAFEEILVRDLPFDERGRDFDDEKTEEGLKLFSEWFLCLWT